MAWYEYRCKNKKCSQYDKDKVIDKNIVNADRVELCFQCEEPMIKQICTTNFILKGGGWYGK